MHAASSTTIGKVWKKLSTRVLNPRLSTRSSWRRSASVIAAMS